MALDIPRIEMKPLEGQLRIDVAWEVDDLVRTPAHLKRFREQIKVCNAMVTAYEKAFEERERRKKERRKALRAKYAKDIARIKRSAKYSGDEAPGEGYEEMQFLAADRRPMVKRRPKRDWDGDVCGWVKLQDADDLRDEDEVFPESDLPPKPFPAPRVIVTGQRTDSRPPKGDEYLPGYYWMLAAIHDTTLEQRPQIITERKGLHENLALELRASDMMLKAPPYTYEHVGCALDDVRADLERMNPEAVARPSDSTEGSKGGQGGWGVRAGQQSEAETGLPGMITLSEAAARWSVFRSTLSRAASKPMTDPNRLPSKRVGRNVYVDPKTMEKWYANYDARREQKAVGTKSPEHGNEMRKMLRKLGEESRTKPS